MPKAWEDPRIASGMKQQLRWRRELLSSGKRPLGWKLAFGGPAAMERLHTNAPLVGFLMADAVVASGSNISLSGWTKPAAEPELTVYLGKDLNSGADRRVTMGAIAGLGAAIEVADVDHPSDDLRPVQELVVATSQPLGVSGPDLPFCGRVHQVQHELHFFTEVRFLAE